MQENVSNASKYVIKALLGLGVVLLAFWVIVRVVIFFDITYSLTTLSTYDGEYRFNLRTPIYADMTSRVFCRIKQRGRTIGEAFIGVSGNLEGIEFILIEQEHVVALVENSTPHIVLMLFDRTDRTYWTSYNDGLEDKKKNTGGHLLEILNNGQEMPFILNGEVFNSHQRIG